MAGLNEYKNAHPETAAAPLPEAQAMKDTAQEIREAQRRREDADKMKKSVLLQLEQGNAPQLILYTAIKAIGLYTNDPEWQQTAQGYLDRVYADIMQESFIADNAAVAQQRLEEMREEYNKKLRQRLDRDYKNYKELMRLAESIVLFIDMTKGRLDRTEQPEGTQE